MGGEGQGGVRLTFPSHVQKVPLSSIVLVSMTSSIFSTLSCGVRMPSTSHSVATWVTSLFHGGSVGEVGVRFPTCHSARDRGGVEKRRKWKVAFSGLNVRRHFAGVHRQDRGLGSFPFQLGSQVPEHLVQGCLRGGIRAKSGTGPWSLCQWSSALLDVAMQAGPASVHTDPSSKSRKFVAEPESLEMKTIVPMAMPAARSFCAVMMGPMVFVERWRAKSENDLCRCRQTGMLIRRISWTSRYISVAR